MAKVTSVIDIGSNSARMAIFRKTSRFGFHLIHEIKSKVRISEGCYENGGMLQEIPMQRALNALKDFLEIAKSHKTTKLFCVATSAIRDAPNAREFLTRAKKECNLNIKVIDGQKEAFYGGIACANLLHKRDGITIDIGGGSTECAFIQNGKITDLISLNVGTIRIKELFFDKHSDLEGAKAYIQNELAKIPKHYRHDIVFGIGGTIRAVAKMLIKHTEYPLNRIHGYEFSPKEHKKLFDKITTSPLHKLQSLPIPQDRLDTIVSGVLIFASFLEHLGAKEVITSGVGVREGVFLADLLRNQRYQFPTGFNPSVASLQERFSLQKKYSNSLKSLTLELFDTLAPLHKCDGSLRYLLGVAAYLSPIGTILNFYQTNLHGAYILLNGLEYGFSHAHREIIALLIEYSDKKIPKIAPILQSHMPPLPQIQWLSFILGLAQCLLKARDTHSKITLECEHIGEYTHLHIRSTHSLYLTREYLPRLQKPNSKLHIKIH